MGGAMALFIPQLAPWQRIQLTSVLIFHRALKLETRPKSQNA
jgi:hypothetical protein